MNFDEFRQASKRTMRFTPEHRANAALGLVGELGEYLTPGENQYEEAGDALFYHGWLCEFYTITPTPSRDLIYDRLDMLMCAAAIADMVKKEVFHGKPVDREAMTKHLSDIYGYFYHNYGENALSNIYKANIAKLALRHPIDKGYTNEGQNARADEIIAQCSPCACDRGTIQYSYDMLPDKHGLNCSYCGFGTFGKDVAMAIEKWNSVNIDAPVTLDPCGNCGTTEHIIIGASDIKKHIRCTKCDGSWIYGSIDAYDELRQKWNARQAEIRSGNEMMQHVTAHAQSGNAEQAAAYEAHIFGQTFGQVQDDLLAAMKAQTQTALNALYGLLVKKTADGLPNESIDVLIWVDELWEYAHIGTDGDWYDYQDRYWGSNEVKYWLPLPTFNPESE